MLAKLGPGDMAGEIGVVFNIPQPFTVRTRRLSQVIRIGHHQFKEMIQSDIDDAKMIITNFMTVNSSTFRFTKRNHINKAFLIIL